jgi:hypothetical protein
LIRLSDSPSGSRSRGIVSLRSALRDKEMDAGATFIFDY